MKRGRQRRFDLANLQTCGHKSTYITKLNTTQLVICRGSSTAYAQPLIVEMNSQNHIFFQIKSNQIRIVLVVSFLEYILWMVNIASPPSPPQPQCPPPHPYWTKFTLGLTCDDFTFSLGPLKAKIHAFSDGLSENDWKS